MRAAQSFTFFCCIAVLLMPLVIPMLLWIAASIFVYAAAACHPNPKICDFIKYSGYRFYGVVGTIVVVLNFSSQLSKAVGGWLYLSVIIWVLSMLVVIPLGVRDMRRAKKEPWQTMTVEVENE
ncbi:MAG TPA: hypothetical protein VK974_08805 [Methylophilaceae bacterium]|nr:hypothetical protein [Methylophilaceae bacterium]